MGDPEELKKLRDFILELSREEENEWFAKELSPHFEQHYVSKNFPEFFKYLKKEYRQKAKSFYSDIESQSLKASLIKDNVQMHFFMVINDAGKFLLYEYYQIENILNHYCKESNCYEKIKLDQLSYNMPLSEKMKVNCSDDFLFKNNPKKLKNIGLWPKIVYWAIDQNKEAWLSDQNIYPKLWNLMNVRNKLSHRNSSDPEAIERANKSIEVLKGSTIESYSFYHSILREFKNSLSKIDPKAKELNKRHTLKINHPRVIDKIDLNQIN